MSAFRFPVARGWGDCVRILQGAPVARRASGNDCLAASRHDDAVLQDEPSRGPGGDRLADGRGVDEEEIGGSQQIIFNNELIIPLLTEVGVKGVLFFDCGNAFLADDGIDFGDLRYAAGWGIRWLSPFGPLRIEIGYPLDRQEGEKSSVFQFAFGSPF